MSQQGQFPRRRRGSLFGPLLLIALGIIFLLNNVNVLQGDVWNTILRLWPLILIVIGLDSLYQRQGLGKAVMCEGLRRVKRLGATLAFVGGYSTEANALYRAVAGPDYDRSEQWTKHWS